MGAEPFVLFAARDEAAQHVRHALSAWLPDERSLLASPPDDPATLQIEEDPKSMVVTRGGFGGRPAYIRTLADVVLVSRSLAAMVAASRALGAAVTLDADALAMRARYMNARTPEQTVFREIVCVAPGTRVEIARDALTVTRTELAPPRASRTPASSMADLQLQLRGHLACAIERATASCDRVGVMTGGGLDSSALLALTHARGVEVNAFAIDFAGPGDDRPHLDALAASVGIAPERLAPADAELPDSLAADGLPLCWPSAAAEATLLSRARSWGARRVLCGLFADACFDGAAWTFVQKIQRLVRSHATRFLPASMRALWRQARQARQARSVARAFEGPRLRRIRRELRDVSSPPEPRRSDWSDRDEADLRIRDAFFSSHLASAAELRAQEESLAGIARVDPYLDAELVTFALSLAPEALVAGGVRRGLFREALAGVLPESLRTRPDKASFAPLHASLFRPPLVERILAYRSFEALADLRIVEPRAARRAVAEAATNAAFAARHGADLYALLAAESFARAHAA